MTVDIDMQEQLNADGRLNYLKYKYKGSTVKVGFGYNPDGRIKNITIPSFLNLKHQDIFNIITQMYMERINTIAVIKLIDKITLVDTISAITNIANINSVDLIDRITLLDRITLIDTITNIATIASITNILNVASVDLIDRITLVDTISAITNIANIVSVDLIDRITLVDTISAITNIANIASLDLVDRITLIDTISAITNIGTITTLTGITNPINVKTSGGTNIVLDALTQGAYLERRSSLVNNGATPVDCNASGALRRGKFFPRGARGFIDSITLYCKDNGAGGGTLTVSLSPHPGLGAITSAIITIPASGVWGDRAATFQYQWNYDSMFIWVAGSTADMYFAWDAEDHTKDDTFRSNDSGATWYSEAYRIWIAVYLEGQTCGDVPVSGTVNNIEIPNSTSSSTSGAVTVNDATLTSLKTITGSGKVTRMAFTTSHDAVEIRIYVDGVLINVDSIMGTGLLTADSLNAYGYTVTTPQIQLLVYANDSTCSFVLLIPFGFKRSFELKAYQSTGGPQTVYTGIIVDLIS